MYLFLRNVTFIDWKTLEFKQCHIRVHEGPNSGIDFLDEIPGDLPSDVRIIDCKGKLVTKSFGCGHHHIYSALARGMGAPKKIPANFHEVLQYVWWALDKCLTTEMIEASALSTAIFCAKNGVTFVIDHHASPFAIEKSLETIANAFEKVGVSSLLCYEISDRDGDIPANKGLEETEAFLKNGGQGLVGLHASFTVGNDLMQRAVDLAAKYGSGIHIHAAEDMIDQEYAIRDYNKRVVERLNAAGALNFKKSILGHCLHIDDKEREILCTSAAYVAQNTESNLNNRVGTFNSKMLNPDHIMLGTDGMHSDMLRSAKAAYFVGQTAEGISPDGIYRRFRNVHRYIEENGFHGDNDNNLVILNYDSPTEVTPGNFPGHFVYGLESSHVESVISNGKLIVENREVLTVDEPEILNFSREMGSKLWKALSGN